MTYLYLYQNKKGNISIIALVIINLLLFQIIYMKSHLVDVVLYNQTNTSNYNLFALENLLAKMVYQDYEHVSLKKDNLIINSKLNNKNENLEIIVDVLINKDKLTYYILYDQECIRILDFYLQSKSLL